jgi:hypothetical protein
MEQIYEYQVLKDKWTGAVKIYIRDNGKLFVIDNLESGV